MKHTHLNYIILSDGHRYYLFERLGKDVPFEAYNTSLAIDSAESETDLLEKIRSRKSNSLESKKLPPLCEVETKPYEVIFNE